MDEDEAGGRPRAACSGSVLEKEFQSKVQTGVQDVSSFGSFSKSAIGFSSDSSAGGIGPEAIVGEESLGNRGQGVGGVVRVGAQCFGPKELKIGPILWEAHNRSGPGEVSLKPVLAEAQLQGVESEPRPFLLKGCLVGCEERPFLLKGSLVDCEESFGVGFGPRVVGLKGDTLLRLLRRKLGHQRRLRELKIERISLLSQRGYEGFRVTYGECQSGDHR
eukprot:XP_019072932.1 PREDICTED: uncharacterized protein LOC109121847 [Vitis vinifera]